MAAIAAWNRDRDEVVTEHGRALEQVIIWRDLGID
jgi:hypothetical protein